MTDQTPHDADIEAAPSDASCADVAEGQTSGVPAKVCPNCSVQEQTNGAFCPHCGSSYIRKEMVPKRKRSRRFKTIVAAVVVLLIGGGSTTALILKHNHDTKIARENAQKRAAARAEARAEAEAEAEAARKRKEKKAEDDITRSLRRLLVHDLEKSITKDAKKDVAAGVLDPPILGSQCTPIGGGNLSNLDQKTGRYECLAINKRIGGGQVEGYRFSATVNYEDSSYTWHLGD